MFRPRTRLAALPLLLVLAAPCVRAGAGLEVTGEVVARTPQLEVRVLIGNPGDEPAVPLSVVGELFGQHAEARIARGVPAGGEAAVILGFDAAEARPGIHALTLLLEHPVGGAPDAVGNRPVESQRAYLSLTIGPVLAPAVTLEVECAEDAPKARCTTLIDVQGEVPVRLSSADGEAHAVSVRALTARGLRPVSARLDAEVPATGSVSLAIPLARAGARRGSRHGVLLLAETPSGAFSRTAVASAVVEIAPYPALLPRLRLPLLVLGLALLAAAVVVEWRQKRRGDRESASPADPAPSGGRAP